MRPHTFEADERTGLCKTCGLAPIACGIAQKARRRTIFPPRGAQSYPDQITNPPTPPTVDGTEVTRDA